MLYSILSESTETPGTFVENGTRTDETAVNATWAALSLTAQDSVQRALVPFDTMARPVPPYDDVKDYLSDAPDPQHLAALNAKLEDVGLAPVADKPPPPQDIPITYKIFVETPRDSGGYTDSGKTFTGLPEEAMQKALDLMTYDGARRAMVPHDPTSGGDTTAGDDTSAGLAVDGQAAADAGAVAAQRPAGGEGGQAAAPAPAAAASAPAPAQQPASGEAPAKPPAA